MYGACVVFLSYCNWQVTLEICFVSLLSDWYSNCQSSQAFLAWYSWQKTKSGSGHSWPTGCALKEYNEVFMFFVVWSLAAEDKPPGELNPSSYSMTCTLVVVFLRMTSQSMLKQTAQCPVPQAQQGQKYQVLSIGTFDTKCCGWCVLRPQSSPQTSCTAVHRVILGSGNQPKIGNYNPGAWCGLN